MLLVFNETESSSKRRALGSSVLRSWLLDRFFGFCAKIHCLFGFGVHCGLRIFRFSTFSFRFSYKMLMVFGFGIRCGFLFFPIWVPISLRSKTERQLCASTNVESPRSLCRFHLSPPCRIHRGFDMSCYSVLACGPIHDTFVPKDCFIRNGFNDYSLQKKL